jgi:large subunit ribosomal protein L29
MSDNIKKIKELKSEIVILKKSLLNLKFQKSTGQLEKTSGIKSVRIKIARLKTEMSKIYGENNA